MRELVLWSVSAKHYRIWKYNGVSKRHDTTGLRDKPSIIKLLCLLKNHQ